MCETYITYRFFPLITDNFGVTPHDFGHQTLLLLLLLLLLQLQIQYSKYNYNYNSTTSTTATTTTTKTTITTTTLHCTALHYNYHYNNYYNNKWTFQLQLQLQLQLHGAASNHLSVHQWVRSAIHQSQQPTSYRFPIFETSATALCGTYW